MHRQMFARFPMEAPHRGKNIPLCFEKWFLPPAGKFKGNVNKILVMFQTAPKACWYQEFSPWQWRKHKSCRLRGSLLRDNIKEQRCSCAECWHLPTYTASKLYFSVHRGLSAKWDFVSTSIKYQYCHNGLKHETEISTIKQRPRPKTIPPVVLQPAETCINYFTIPLHQCGHLSLHPERMTPLPEEL